MNKKIGLCVCYDTKNFGSQLQVFATQKVIEKQGFDYEIIVYKKKKTPLFLVKSLPRLLNRYFVKGKVSSLLKQIKIKLHPDISHKVAIRNQQFNQFVEQVFCKMSKEYYGYNELKKGAKNYYAVISGSDQLWLPNNLGSHFFTQEFVPDNIKKIAYATSFGVSKIPWYQIKRTTNYLSRFAFLSSRELRGSEIIKELLQKKVQTVLDPTLLFSYDEWLEFIPDKKVVEGDYIFCYFLGKNELHRKVSIKLQKEINCKIVTVPFLDHFITVDVKFGDIQLFNINSFDFVNLIRNAKYVLTDSFHGSVFSILNHKKFITFDRFNNNFDSRNSRIDSLLSLLELQNRRFQREIVSEVSDDIVYENVDRKLNELRKASIEYIIDALKD